MIDYLSTQDESKCCGCGACKEICPQKAIILAPNDEGFMYPTLIPEKCVGCKLCEKVCPEMVDLLKQKPLEIFAVQNKNKEELLDSSSGGVFRLIADSVISQGGCVVGCTWNDYAEPVLKVTNTLSELKSMQGSKYLSSSTECTFSEVKEILDYGKIVLFTGTPCQCAGLLTFLRQPYDNLITMDFLCHGVPSQLAFNAYKSECEKKHHNGKMTQYKFRDKSNHGWAISESYLINGKKYKSHGMTSPYLFGFISGYFNRYSCYSCRFRGLERFTDYTVCDYWGYSKHFDTFEGVSAFQVNTQKGKEFMATFSDKALIHLTDREDVARENPAILHSFNEDIPELRKMIYQLIRDGRWATIERKYLKCKNFYIKRLWYALPDNMLRAIKKIIRGK